MSVSVTLGDCMAVLAARDGPLFDACITDAPYELGFMGKKWDSTGIAFRPELWRAVYDQMKPGAHLVAFSGTRTYHRMACAIEDAGFEIRDQLQWIYGSGFPKSHDVSKGIDKAAGAAREVVGHKKLNPRDTKVYTPNAQTSFVSATAGRNFSGLAGQQITAPATDNARKWQGWGSALKPAHEPICLARKPLSEKSIAANVVKHGTGAINVDVCRVEGVKPQVTQGVYSNPSSFNVAKNRLLSGDPNIGRWPANILHDGSDEVTAGFPDSQDGMAVRHKSGGKNCHSDQDKPAMANLGYGGSGSAARFFYSAKAGPLDRLGSPHPTVKPVDVMRWLVRLVTPPGGLILDPFAGSGTTGIAAMAEGFDCELIDLMPDHVADIERKLAFLRGEGRLTVQEHINGREARKDAGASALPILDWLAA